ncbi:MAG: ATP-dependent DNA ligase, partial [Thermoleophilaceae bacterium]|nr:ATP-dependent DNA ligase [Thermoleophilaceae bacterium]
MSKKERITLELDGHEVGFSSPGRVIFPERGHTKLDLWKYYDAVADACLGHLRDRPTTMKRFKEGAAGDFFFQKRVPAHAPDWIEQMTLSFPSGRSANFLVCQDEAHLAWALNLGVIDWNPWPVRRPDGDHPDELRVDLDPTPESSFAEARAVALCVNEVLEEHDLTGFPKTSGSR